MDIQLSDGRKVAADELIASLQRVGERVASLEHLLSGSYQYEAPGVWIARDGRRIPFAALDYQHLENIIAFLGRKIDGLKKKRDELVVERDHRVRTAQARRMLGDDIRDFENGE